MGPSFPPRFLPLSGFVSIWINISEIFRYFVIVMPAMRKYLTMVPGVAPMNLPVFLIWGLWDTLLTMAIVFISWLCANWYGKSRKAIFIAGTTCWATFFLLFWIAMVNMHLSSTSILIYTLPLSWLETTVAAWMTIRFCAIKAIE